MLYYLGLILAVFLLVLTYLSRWYQSPHNYPPGPFNLPIVGYLPWLDPKAPYLTLTELSKKFGTVYGLYLGNVYTVVLSDTAIVRKTFNSEAASGRAPLYLTHGIMKGKGLICAEGPLWKDQRKFVHNTLRNFGVGKTNGYMEMLVRERIQECVNYFKNQGHRTVLDPLEPLRNYLGTLITKFVLGKSWPMEDETWKWLQELQEEGTKLIGVAGAVNFLPFLRFLPSQCKAMQYIKKGQRESHELYKKIVDEEKNFENEQPTNLIQAFLKERESRSGSKDLEEFYNDSQFMYLIADIFGATLDTTLATLRWFLLYLAVNKKAQKIIRNELPEANGVELLLEEASTSQYLEAAIAETQRIKSVVPVGFPHGTLEETFIDGFRVPKGAMIIPLQWAIHMNPKLWNEPEKFNPERFLDSERKFFKPEAFIPFQVGRRMCVGYELAKMILLLFGGEMIRNFDIDCENDADIDWSGECGITLTPKSQKLVFTSLS